MTTLYSSVLRLHAIHDGALEPTQGHHAHAAFLHIVEQVDPILSQRLHDSNARKPFTLSPLRGLPPPRRGEVCLRAGDECWLRVTLAGERMFETFIQRFMQGEVRPTLRLGEAHFAVSAVLTTPGSHAWAGYTTAEALLCQARPDERIALELASPCSFGLGDQRVELLPRPELVFGGLQKKWTEWCDLPLPAALTADWLREQVLVSCWQVHSQMLRYSQQLQVGSLGTLEYRLFDADVTTACTLNALANFAFFAGVGRKTTQGMGQARRI